VSVIQFHKPVNCQARRLLPAFGLFEVSRCAAMGFERFGVDSHAVSLRKPRILEAG
jgi:hypothetical protein